MLQELFFHNSFIITVDIIICFLWGSDYFFAIADPAYLMLKYSCGTDLKLIMNCFDLKFKRLLSENRLQEIPDQAFKTLTKLKIL